MSAESPPAADKKSADPARAGDAPDGDDETAVGDDHPQDAWSALRDLNAHMPQRLRAGGDGFGGGQVRGDQFGVSGGYAAGDVLVGSSKIEHHYQFTVGRSSTTAGEVPPATLNRLARSFTCDPEEFARLANDLRNDRFLVLTGPAFSGRRTGALMLLRHLGAEPVRILDPETPPTALTDQLEEDRQTPQGLLLCDPDHGRDQRLREPHLLAAREALTRKKGYLVVTMGPDTRLADVPVVPWSAPSAAEALSAHLKALTDEDTANRLLGAEAAKAMLVGGVDYQLREIAAFAEGLVRHDRGAAGEDISEFGRRLLQAQVREWFEEDEKTVPLREKAFLVALAVFDGGPYALTAELADVLYQSLQATEDDTRPDIPVFGTHVDKRLHLARARLYSAQEDTEWGPVEQTKAAFRNADVPLILLPEVWTGHPSARPALINWLKRLVIDGRPLVRTRAASTAAALARVDLPSAMGLIIEKWALSRISRHRIAAANTLALAHSLQTPNIPRILDDWCVREEENLCWTAIRGLALIGPNRPKPSLAALRKAARKIYATDEEKERLRDRTKPTERDRDQHSDQDNDEGFSLRYALQDGHEAKPDSGPSPTLRNALAESVELLLLSDARETVLRELIRTCDSHHGVREMTLTGFLKACAHTVGDTNPYDEDACLGPPTVLQWYAMSETAAAGIATLWCNALGSRTHTNDALDRMREWVLLSEWSDETERALGLLLPHLAVTDTQYRRLSHLLRTMPGEDGAAPPRVAHRLLTGLDAIDHPHRGVRHG